MRLAKKAGFVLWGDGPRKGMVDWACEYDAELAKFEELVRADEREACAKVCEKRETSYQYATDPWALEHIMEAQYCAAAIRARSEE